MRARAKKILVGLAAVAALALGGAAIANATQGGSDEPAQNLTGATAERAGAAALEATGGGTIKAVEADSEQGAIYEVEVRKPDGTVVDVRLDSAFKLVGIDGDSEKAGDSNQE